MNDIELINSLLENTKQLESIINKLKTYDNFTSILDSIKEKTLYLLVNIRSMKQNKEYEKIHRKNIELLKDILNMCDYQKYQK